MIDKHTAPEKMRQPLQFISGQLDRGGAHRIRDEKGHEMFLIPAGTVILVQPPESRTHFRWVNWMPYTTREDRYYDKHQVWDWVAVHNDRDDIPSWALRNITEHNRSVVQCKGKFALVNPRDLIFVD